MKLRSLAADQRGTSVVEFALLIAPFLLLVVGIIEVSRALWTRQALHDVAAATARCVGVGQTECSDDGTFDTEKTERFALAQARGRAVSLAPEAIAIERNADCDGMTGAVVVALSADFPSVFPFDRVIDFSVRACFLDWSVL